MTVVHRDIRCAVCLVLCLCTCFVFCLVCALVIAALLARQPGYSSRLPLLCVSIPPRCPMCHVPRCAMISLHIQPSDPYIRFIPLRYAIPSHYCLPCCSVPGAQGYSLHVRARFVPPQACLLSSNESLRAWLVRQQAGCRLPSTLLRAYNPPSDGCSMRNDSYHTGYHAMVGWVRPVLTASW
jgi:hypothetical protein